MLNKYIKYNPITLLCLIVINKYTFIGVFYMSHVHINNYHMVRVSRHFGASGSADVSCDFKYDMLKLIVNISWLEI